MTDLVQQDAPPLARQAGDEVPAPREPSKWDLIKQKCDYTLSAELLWPVGLTDDGMSLSLFSTGNGDSCRT